MDILVERVILFSENKEDISFRGTDVIVVLTSGVKYAASFVPYSEIENIREHHLQNGDFLNGLYYWGHNMVLAENCEQKTVEMIVDHMIEEGDFQEAFRKL